MDPIIETAIEGFVTYVVPPGLSLITAYAVYLLNKLRNNLKEKKGVDALLIFDTLVENAVTAISQTKVRNIKKIQKRKINNNDIEELKKTATDNIERFVTKQVKNDVKSVIKDYDKFLDDAVEAKVKQLKIKNEKISEKCKTKRTQSFTDYRFK